MTPTQEIFATACFGLAVVHTFLVKRFQHLAHQYPDGSVGENFFHLLGEVEVVFGLWSLIFVTFLSFNESHHAAIQYLESRNFTEPAFVFVILAICSTRPLLDAAEVAIRSIAKLIPLHRSLATYWVTLIVGPLMGSFITEPAAMTVTALLLLKSVYDHKPSEKLKYATLGLLFVNISIGGTLTPYAAPPVLMVASTWNWDLTFMLSHFGWKAALAILTATSLTTWYFRKEIRGLPQGSNAQVRHLPIWVTGLHLAVLTLVVLTSHHMAVFLFLFMFFLGLVSVTREYQSPLKLKEGLLVAFFLGGLVILGGPQRWWLEPLLSQMSTVGLYLGATALTAVTDNAALTYLGSLVPGLSEASKYSLVAGSVVGGGLTVIANAPNPAGYGILNSSFGVEGISPLKLFMFALGPTMIALIMLWLP